MKYWIWLSTLPYIGTVSARKIITVLKNPKNVYYSSEEELRKIGNLTLRQRNSILMNRELENAKRIIEQCEKHRISLLPIENPLYPKRAGNCNDAPIILYYKGTINDLYISGFDTHLQGILQIPGSWFPQCFLLSHSYTSAHS